MGVKSRMQRTRLCNPPIGFVTEVLTVPKEEVFIEEVVQDATEDLQELLITETSQNVALMTCFDYFNAIKAGDYPKAHALTTKTWQAGEKPEWFGLMYTGKLLAFEIDVSTIEFKGNWLDVNVHAEWLANEDIAISLTHRPRMICESEPYKPSTYEQGGVWGVNPVSALRFENDEDKETELP